MENGSSHNAPIAASHGVQDISRKISDFFNQMQYLAQTTNGIRSRAQLLENKERVSEATMDIMVLYIDMMDLEKEVKELGEKSDADNEEEHKRNVTDFNIRFSVCLQRFSTLTEQIATLKNDVDQESRKEMEEISFSQTHRENGKGQCCVCLLDFKLEERVQECPRCKACFHNGCISRWMSNSQTCPHCREQVVMITM